MTTGRAIHIRVLCSLVSLALFMGFYDSSVSTAATGGVRWLVSFVAQPSVFVVSGHNDGEPVDQYSLMLTNTGSISSGGSPVSMTVTLPAGVTLGGSVRSEGWECPATQEGSSVVSCTYTDGAIGPLSQSTVLTIPVAVSTDGTVTASVSVSGGEAPTAVASRATRVVPSGAPPPQFEFLGFSSDLDDMSGGADLQAGAHPFALTTALYFSQRELEEAPGSPILPVRKPGDVEFDLPEGFIGNPQAVTRCTIVGVYDNTCPPSSRVGTLLVNFAQGLFGGSGAFPIYNVVPERGFPAEFGVFLTSINLPAFFYASVTPGPTYNVHVSAPSIPATGKITSLVASFFGDPESFNAAGNEPVPFLTNPSDCSGGSLVTEVEADGWEEPGDWIKTEDSSPPVVGCDLLQFQPSLSVNPENLAAGEPSGYTFNASLPQSTSGVEGLATPPVKNVSVTLPSGMALSSSAADGLMACPEGGPEGINLSSPGQGGCPLASQIGTAEAVTPLLSEPLKGQIYLATPGCGGAGQTACGEADALDGNLFGIYLQLEGSGIVAKIRGNTSVNPTTGQVTATFSELPQDPVSSIKLQLYGGPRAALANPPTCGEAQATADFVPWSSPDTPDARLSAGFPVTGCVSSLFAPSFLAGTTGTEAGKYTNFVTTISRPDRMQDLGVVQVQIPRGLLGSISHVTLCGEPQANQGACPAASRVGTASAAVGPGSHPFWVSGPVYLTGPYRGAPFGLSIAIPAIAGPFNLGTVVVRATVTVNPDTAALTVTSDPLPQILDGVPLHVQTVNVTVDRPQFMFNPTSCAAQQVTATVASAQGSTAQVASPFAAGGCKNLPFNPGFGVSARAPGSKKRGVSFDVKVSSMPGEANIHSVAVSLPKQLPARLTTIQKACRDTVFNVNPAACPPGSLIGIVVANSPLLPVKLSGPAYLVSHGGAAFPDLDVIVQGEGVRVDLTGSINITRSGITSSTFANVPDVPVSSFELRLPEGPYSALAVNGSLCAKPLTMPTTIIGQNGRRLVRTTKIAIAGCAKAKNKRAAKNVLKQARRTRGGRVKGSKR